MIRQLENDISKGGIVVPGGGQLPILTRGVLTPNIAVEQWCEMREVIFDVVDCWDTFGKELLCIDDRQKLLHEITLEDFMQLLRGRIEDANLASAFRTYVDGIPMADILA